MPRINNTEAFNWLRAYGILASCWPLIINLASGKFEPSLGIERFQDCGVHIYIYIYIYIYILMKESYSGMNSIKLQQLLKQCKTCCNETKKINSCMVCLKCGSRQ